jgi:hypothetical protein
MVFSWHRTSVLTAASICAITLLGAAAPVERASIAPLAPSVYDEDAQAPSVKKLTAQSANYAAAPVPDQDVNGPADTTKPEASVSPKLLSQKSLFQGDGYYYASSEQSTLDGRRAGVPGLGLSVPVK